MVARVAFWRVKEKEKTKFTPIGHNNCGTKELLKQISPPVFTNLNLFNQFVKQPVEETTNHKQAWGRQGEEQSIKDGGDGASGRRRAEGAARS